MHTQNVKHIQPICTVLYSFYPESKANELTTSHKHLSTNQVHQNTNQKTTNSRQH